MDTTLTSLPGQFESDDSLHRAFLPIPTPPYACLWHKVCNAQNRRGLGSPAPLTRLNAIADALAVDEPAVVSGTAQQQPFATRICRYYSRAGICASVGSEYFNWLDRSWFGLCKVCCAAWYVNQVISLQRGEPWTGISIMELFRWL
jgi:hypothetical protein